MSAEVAKRIASVLDVKEAGTAALKGVSEEMKLFTAYERVIPVDGA